MTIKTPYCKIKFMNKQILILGIIFILLSTSSYADECEKMKQNIRSAISQKNYCTYDSDCKIADLHCPFVNSLVNKNSDLRKIKTMTSKYENVCGTCIYDIVALKQSEIKCIAKKCININP